MKKRDNGLARAINAVGSISALARMIETSRQNVSKWKRIPVCRCRQINKLTGIPLKSLRPDIYG